MANTYAISLVRASSQYLKATTNKNNAFDITGDFTLEAEVNLYSFPAITGVVYTIVSKYLNTGNNRSYEMFFFIGATSKEIHLKVSDDGSRADEYTWQYNFLVSTCYRIAITWKASAAGVNAATLYVLDTSGNILYSATATASPNNGITSVYVSTAQYLIGASQDGTADDTLDANSIDDVRLWSAVLSQGTIQTNANRELAGNEANLNAYHKLNNNYNDATSNGNTLTPVNVPSFTTNVCFLDNTTTSTSTTTTTTSTSTTSTSSSTSITTSTSTSTSSTISTTSTSTTTTSTSTTSTSTSTTSTSTSTTTTSTSTTTTSTSTSISTSTSTTTTVELTLGVENVE